MPTLIEARQAVLDDAVAAMETYVDGSYPGPNPPGVSQVASGRAAKHRCTGLSAGEIESHLRLYLSVRQAYREAYPGGSAAELQAVWRDAAAAYQEEAYQRCVAGQPATLSVKTFVQDAVEEYRG